METKATRPPTTRKVKSVGFKERPYVTARIRAELVGRLVGLTYTQVQKKMHSQGLSIKSLDDCVKFTQSFYPLQIHHDAQRID